MLCPTCDRANPDGVRYCDCCGTALLSDDAAPTPAAIGPTVHLEATPPAAQASDALLPVEPAANQRLTRSRQMNGGLWLIGLGLLFLTGTFWPGILVLGGISGYLEESARGRQKQGMRTLVFAVGLAFLFEVGWFWPGILIVLGLTALLSPEVRRQHA